MLRAAAVLLAAAWVATGAPGENLTALAQKVIPQNHELSHPPVELQFGPPGKHIVILHAPKDETDFSGTVLMNANPGAQQYTLPGPDTIPRHFEFSVESVMSERLGRSAERDLIVLYSYHRNGSTSDDGNACLVYHWDGKSFQVSHPWSDKLTGAKNAGEVRARLRKMMTGKAAHSKTNTRGTK